MKLVLILFIFIGSVSFGDSFSVNETGCKVGSISLSVDTSNWISGKLVCASSNYYYDERNPDFKSMLLTAKTGNHLVNFRGERNFTGSEAITLQME